MSRLRRAMPEGSVDGFTPEQRERLRAANARDYAGWTADGFYRLHRRTLRDTSAPDEYLAAVRAKVASGLYAVIYPDAALRGTEQFLREQEGRGR